MSLEVIVRPFVNPDTRPKARAPKPVVDERITEIAGRRGSFIQLSHSESTSWNTSNQTEVKRTFDVVRVKNPDDDQQHVDVEVTTKLRVRNADNSQSTLRLAKPTATENTEILEEDRERDSNIPVN